MGIEHRTYSYSIDYYLKNLSVFTVQIVGIPVHPQRKLQTSQPVDQFNYVSGYLGMRSGGELLWIFVDHFYCEDEDCEHT